MIVMNMVLSWNDTDGKPEFPRRNTCSIITSPTTNPIWAALESNSGLCGEKSMMNRLIHGTFFVFFVMHLCYYEKHKNFHNLRHQSHERLTILRAGTIMGLSD